MEKQKLFIGQKIWFASEKKPYKVKAFNERFVICTKPFNLQKTVFYTIIDLQEDIRGTENYINCTDYDDAIEAMEEYGRQLLSSDKQPVMNQIFEFIYTDCIYESAMATMSTHRTKKGAYKAMRAFLNTDYMQWYNERIEYGKYDKSRTSKYGTCFL